jgi:phosphopentomutase
VPADFHIEPRERRVLNALGEGGLTARGIGQMLDVADPVSFMEELTRKLESYSLDLVQPGEPQGGEPTYRLRR